MEKAVKIKEHRINVDMSKGMDAILPSQHSYYIGAQMLGDQALFCTERGQMLAVHDALKTMHAMGKVLCEEPIMSLNLIGLVIVFLQVETIEECMNRGSFEDLILQQRIVELSQINPAASMRRTLVSENAMANVMFEDTDSAARLLGQAMFGTPKAGYPLVLLGLHKMNRLASVNHMLGLIDATNKPYPQLYTTFKCAEKKVVASPGYMSIFASLTPSMDRYCLVNIRTLAIVRCCIGALSIERYRLQHGKLPADTADVVPTFLDKWPDDPFTGKPLKYKRVGEESLIVYSIGNDKTDDGGKRRDTTDGRYDPGPDIVFKVDRAGVIPD